MENPLKVNNINSINAGQLMLGFILLSIGGLIYLFDRAPDQIFFVYTFKLPSFYNFGNEKIFGFFNSSLPSFLHVCSFSLITCAILPRQRNTNFMVVCASWVGINILCEIGQLITPNMLSGFEFHSVSNRYFIALLNYFLYGTFDLFDVVFAILGGIVAFCILIINHVGGNDAVEFRTNSKN